jgi:hypothetical protein
MNRFVTTALALTAAGGSAFAAPNGDSEWLELDREIGRLSSGYAPRDNSEAGLGALLRVFYGYSDDSVFGSDDISGFELLDVDLWLDGEVGDFSYRIGVELDSGSNADLEDAFVRWACSSYLTSTLGQFKPRVARSASLNPENTFFGERSLIGAAFDEWQTGVGVSGTLDPIRWFFNVMNGTNSSDSDHFWNFRFEFDLGEGAGDYEGAYGGGDGFNATIGASFFNDDTQSGDDASGYAVDFAGSSGPLGFAVEALKIDDDYSGFGRMDIWTIPTATTYGLESDSTPYSALVTWALDDQIELGLRLQDMDNMDDTTQLSFGANYYKSGHNAKWHASINKVDSDTDDGTFFLAGLTVGL